MGRSRWINVLVDKRMKLLPFQCPSCRVMLCVIVIKQKQPCHTTQNLISPLPSHLIQPSFNFFTHTENRIHRLKSRLAMNRKTRQRKRRMQNIWFTNQQTKPSLRNLPPRNLQGNSPGGTPGNFPKPPILCCVLSRRYRLLASRSIRLP